jgi:SAM-dependent methyltransferase
MHLTYKDPCMLRGVSPKGEKQRRRLCARIARRVAITAEPIGADGELFWRPEDPDEVLEKAAREATQAHEPDPFWAAKWLSSDLLALQLDSLANVLTLSIADLGCGLGSFAHAALGRGARVTLLDQSGDAMLIARLNTWPYRDRAIYRRWDWNRDRWAGAPFPLVVGSDIIYRAEDWVSIEASIEALLAPGGEAWLAEPGRDGGDRFVRWLDSRRWSWVERWIPSANPKIAIRWLRLRRRCTTT